MRHLGGGDFGMRMSKFSLLLLAIILLVVSWSRLSYANFDRETGVLHWDETRMTVQQEWEMKQAAIFADYFNDPSTDEKYLQARALDIINSTLGTANFTSLFRKPRLSLDNFAWESRGTLPAAMRLALEQRNARLRIDAAIEPMQKKLKIFADQLTERKYLLHLRNDVVAAGLGFVIGTALLNFIGGSFGSVFGESFWYVFFDGYRDMLLMRRDGPFIAMFGGIFAGAGFIVSEIRNQLGFERHYFDRNWIARHFKKDVCSRLF